MISVLFLATPAPAQAERGAVHFGHLLAHRSVQLLSGAARPLGKRPLVRGTHRRLRGGLTRLKRTAGVQFAAGLLHDGPKDTWHAIKKNPRGFVVGMCLTGAFAAAGDFFGVATHNLLVGASGAVAGAEVIQLGRTELRQARTRSKRWRIAGKMAWLPALVVATALGGSAVGGHASEGGAAATLPLASIGASAVRSFASGVITGGDLPMGVVTTLQGWRDQLRSKRSRK